MFELFSTIASLKSIFIVNSNIIWKKFCQYLLQALATSLFGAHVKEQKIDMSHFSDIFSTI